MWRIEPTGRSLKSGASDTCGRALLHSTAPRPRDHWGIRRRKPGPVGIGQWSHHQPSNQRWSCGCRTEVPPMFSSEPQTIPSSLAFADDAEETCVIIRELIDPTVNVVLGDVLEKMVGTLDMVSPKRRGIRESSVSGRDQTTPACVAGSRNSPSLRHGCRGEYSRFCHRYWDRSDRGLHGALLAAVTISQRRYCHVTDDLPARPGTPPFIPNQNRAMCDDPIDMVGTGCKSGVILDE